MGTTEAVTLTTTTAPPATTTTSPVNEVSTSPTTEEQIKDVSSKVEVITSPQPADAEEEKGICGPTMVAALALVPLVLRRKRR